MTEETKDVANYDEMLAKLAKKATAVERPTTSSINCKSGVLTYNKEPVPDNKLDCIIIASTHSNLYYDQKWDADNPVNPVCYAYSEDGENMKPHPKADKPQAESCDKCPMNQWNSDPEGGRGKACKNARRLALIPAGTTVADLPTAEIATLQLPVTSVQNWSMYVNKLSTLYNRPPLGVITTISSKPDVKTQFKLTFNTEPNKMVGNDLIAGVFKKAEEAMTLIERVYEPNPEPSEEDKEKAAKRQARGKKY